MSSSVTPAKIRFDFLKPAQPFSRSERSAFQWVVPAEHPARQQWQNKLDWEREHHDRFVTTLAKRGRTPIPNRPDSQPPTQPEEPLPAWLQTDAFENTLPFCVFEDEAASPSPFMTMSDATTSLSSESPHHSEQSPRTGADSPTSNAENQPPDSSMSKALSKPIPRPASPTEWSNRKTLRSMLGPDLSRIRFCQGKIGDCYLVAALDAAIHHERGEHWFNQIMVEDRQDTQGRLQYRLTFPSGRQGMVCAAELGKEKNKRWPLSGPKPLQMIELAYIDMTREERNRSRPQPFENGGIEHSFLLAGGGCSAEALYHMFGGYWAILYFSEDLPAEMTYSHTKPLSQNPRATKKLASLLSGIQADPMHDYILCAGTPKDILKPPPEPNTTRIFTQTNQCFLRDHFYSVRSFDLTQQTITVANPQWSKNKVITLSFEEFCDVFQDISVTKLLKPILKKAQPELSSPPPLTYYEYNAFDPDLWMDLSRPRAHSL